MSFIFEVELGNSCRLFFLSYESWLKSREKRADTSEYSWNTVIVRISPIFRSIRVSLTSSTFWYWILSKQKKILVVKMHFYLKNLIIMRISSKKEKWNYTPFQTMYFILRSDQKFCNCYWQFYKTQEIVTWRNSEMFFR